MWREDTENWNGQSYFEFDYFVFVDYDKNRDASSILAWEVLDCVLWWGLGQVKFPNFLNTAPKIL